MDRIIPHEFLKNEDKNKPVKKVVLFIKQWHPCQLQKQ